MSKNPENHPSFADQAERIEMYVNDPSLNLRDHFAASSLQGVLANPQINFLTGTPQGRGELAFHCYQMADAMLAERAKA